MKIFTKYLLVGSCVLAFVVCSFVTVASTYAEQLNVGTIQLNQIYKKYERADDFREWVEIARKKVLRLREKFKKPGADKEKIKQRMNELRAELAWKQKQIDKDIKRAGRKIAQQQNLALVVYFVLYKGQNIQLQDITQPVIDLLNETYEQEK